MKHKLLEAEHLLGALLGNQSLVEQWWTTANRAFDDQRPADVWDMDPDRVLKYLVHAAYVGGGT